jgi:hypothetical protein
VGFISLNCALTRQPARKACAKWIKVSEWLGISIGNAARQAGRGESGFKQTLIRTLVDYGIGTHIFVCVMCYVM